MAKLFELKYQGAYKNSETTKHIAARTYLQAFEKSTKLVKKLYNTRIKSLIEIQDDVEIA